jgi:hypothetical protein
MPMVCGAKAIKNQTPEWCSTNNSPGSFAAPAWGALGPLLAHSRHAQCLTKVRFWGQSGQ